ncbi:hypothetical protein N0V88_007636 [Collariella sp. IMI 366227]|nr:hypothetical protein N0V88_007636 [Collariella sp. IMI 366227]
MESLVRNGAWAESISSFLTLRTSSSSSLPALLTYDRYGQGKSASDPSDPPNTPYGHDAREVITDLHQLLTQISSSHLHCSNPSDLRLVFICNSIGCVLARLYAAQHPGTVSAFIFLDSMMANTDFVSIFPDPDQPDFNKKNLPKDITADDLRYTRKRFENFFHPDVTNSEHFDRRNLRELLPRADEPKLPDGPGGREPLLTVVGHDWDEFAEQCEHGSMLVSAVVINAYMNPKWGRYNEGLTRLVKTERKVKIAEGCGHFIQKDDPEFVAGEINSMLDDLENWK